MMFNQDLKLRLVLIPVIFMFFTFLLPQNVLGFSDNKQVQKKNKNNKPALEYSVDQADQSLRRDFEQALRRFETMQADGKSMASLADADLIELEVFMSQFSQLDNMAMALGKSTESVDIIRVAIKKLIAKKLIYELRSNPNIYSTPDIKQKLISALARIGIVEGVSNFLDNIEFIQNEKNFHKRNMDEAREKFERIEKDENSIYKAILDRIK